MDSLEEAKRIFLTDVDEETYKENLERIEAWQKELLDSEEYISWQEHPFTQKVLKKARETYVMTVVVLGKRRNLSDEMLAELRGAQDATAWLIDLMSEDKKSQLISLQEEIKKAVNATKG